MSEEREATPRTTSAGVRDIDPQTLQTWLTTGEVVLVDVREPVEHAQARIAGSQLRPLTAFDGQRLANELADKPAVLYCRTGRRSQEAAAQLAAAAPQGEIYNLQGGIEGWKQAGFKTERLAGAPKLEIMRQVQIAAGGLVLLGTLLGALVTPWFLLLSGVVGAGLMFAGITGFCGMARLLARMPWNRTAGSAGSQASDATPSDQPAPDTEALRPSA